MVARALYVVYRESLLDPDELYAITDTEQGARLLLDKPNFDLRIEAVMLDEFGMVLEKKDL